MPKQKVKVGQEVKDKCPVCGNKKTDHFTFRQLHNTKKVAFECEGCFTELWYYPCTGKITVKKIDKIYDG